jgi:hypothetical protein
LTGAIVPIRKLPQGSWAVVAAVVIWAHFVIKCVGDPGLDWPALHYGFSALVDGRSPYFTTSSLSDAQAAHSPFFVYPPSSVVLMTPIGALPSHLAWVIYVLVSTALLPIAAGVLAKRLSGRLDVAGVTAVVVLSDKLFRLSTSGGNIDALLAGVILTGFLLVDPFKKGRIQPRPVLAGLLLGAAVAIKPTAVLLILLVLVVDRGFRALVAAGVTAAALTGLGFLVVIDSDGFFRSALPWLKAGQPTVLVQRIGIGDALRSIDTPSWFLNPSVIGLQTLLLLVLILVLGPWGQRRNHTVGREVQHSWFWLAVGLGTCVCVIVTPYAFEVYAVYTCIAVAVLLGRWFRLSELSRLVLVLAILAGHSPVSWRSGSHAVDTFGRFGVVVSVLLLAGLLVAQAESERRSGRDSAPRSDAGSPAPVTPRTMSVR